MFVFIWILNLFSKCWQRVVEALPAVWLAAAQGAIKLWELGFGAGDGDATWTQLMRDFDWAGAQGRRGWGGRAGLQLPAPNEGCAALFMQGWVLRCRRWMAEELTGRATNLPSITARVLRLPPCTPIDKIWAVNYIRVKKNESHKVIIISNS